jgi:hypothetical protein
MGSQDQLHQFLEPVFQVATPDLERIEQHPYWDGQQRLADAGEREIRQTRSRYVYSELPVEAADLVLESFARWPGSGGGASWKAYLVGGAVDKIGRRSTAYVHRGASMLTSLELSWKGTDPGQRISANLAWLDRLHKDLEPYTSAESYQGFSDPSLVDFPQAYYGENLTYLMSLKRRLDPERAFSYEQAVPHDLEA